MADRQRVIIVSDIHYPSAAERARVNYEFQGIHNPLVRLLLRAYRHFIWMRDGLGKAYLLDRFLEQANGDWCIANGDYSCDSGFIGITDEAACESARECLQKLSTKFGAKLRANIGDHELGKLSFVGGQGGMRISSWSRVTGELGLEPLWRVEIGRYVLLGITSSLVALPVFAHDALPEEMSQWEAVRAQHLGQIQSAFESLDSDQRVVLFCHDPTALPFLWRMEAVRSRVPLLEQTIVGHLHSKLVLLKSRFLAGVPVIRFLGHTPLRLTTALNEARHWRAFHVRLCPALAGIELLKDGGYLEACIDPEARKPIEFRFRPVPG